MAGNLKGRHFLKLLDFTAAEMADLLELSATLKSNKKAGVRTRSLDGKSIALIFEKPSTRTRISFEVGVTELGGTALVLHGKPVISVPIFSAVVIMVIVTTLMTPPVLKITLSRGESSRKAPQPE